MRAFEVKKEKKGNTHTAPHTKRHALQKNTDIEKKPKKHRKACMIDEARKKAKRKNANHSSTCAQRESEASIRKEHSSSSMEGNTGLDDQAPVHVVDQEVTKDAGDPPALPPSIIESTEDALERLNGLLLKSEQLSQYVKGDSSGRRSKSPKYALCVQAISNL